MSVVSRGQSLQSWI